MLQISRWSFWNREIFSYFQQKRRYDVTKATQFCCPRMWTVVTNGLNGIFKIRFFLNFDGFRTENGQKVSFGHVFWKKMNFGMSINPLRSRAFSKIHENSVSNFELQMTIKWWKMVQLSGNKNRNVANFTLIILNKGNFFISPTEKALWRHQWYTVFVLLWSNTGP